MAPSIKSNRLHIVTEENETESNNNPETGRKNERDSLENIVFDETGLESVDKKTTIINALNFTFVTSEDMSSEEKVETQKMFIGYKNRHPDDKEAQSIDIENIDMVIAAMRDRIRKNIKFM